MPSRKESVSEDRLDAVFHALSDRTRRALLDRLSVAPGMITELASGFPMSLPAVSRHVRVLESAGLVSRAVDGRVHRCSINPKALRSVEQWVSGYREFWEGNLESLAEFVESRSGRK